MEKYGIEELQKIFDAALALEKLIKADLADKKLKWMEVMGIAIQLYAIQDFIDNKELIKNQFNDLSPEEIKILLRDAATSINNQQISDLIEKLFMAIELGIGLYKAIRDLLKKKAAPVLPHPTV